MTSREAEAAWESLMRMALDGDTAAYHALLTSLAPALRGYLRRNCQRIGLDPGEAEDIVQEVLLAIHLKRDTWDTSRPIAPWIMTIARHKMIDARRRRGRATMTPIEDFANTLSLGDDQESIDRLDLDRLVEQLDKRQRDLVRSLSIEGRSVRETAERLNISEGATRVALHRAIKRLAALYRNEER